MKKREGERGRKKKKARMLERKRQLETIRNSSPPEQLQCASLSWITSIKKKQKKTPKNMALMKPLSLRRQEKLVLELAARPRPIRKSVSASDHPKLQSERTVLTDFGKKTSKNDRAQRARELKTVAMEVMFSTVQPERLLTSTHAGRPFVAQA